MSAKKFNTGREGTQLFVGIQVQHGVSQLNVTRIVVQLNVLPYARLNSPDPYLSSSRYFLETTVVDAIFVLRMNLHFPYFIF